MSLLGAMSTGATAGNEWQEPEAHSFIVKIWVEQAGSGNKEVRWRGSVTHVPGGERISASDLAGILEPIGKHLEELGVRIGSKWRVCLWLLRP